MNFKFFCGSNHLWAYNHVDVSCVMKSSKQENFCLCKYWLLLFHWLTAADINFKAFMEAIIHESIIFWWLQRHSPWKLNADLFCLFDKLSDHYVYRLIDNLLLWNQPSMNLKSCWWLTSSSSDMNFKAFEEAAIIELIICSYLLRDDVIKTKKLLFIWMLIASVYLINCLWQEFQSFRESNHTIY